MGLFRAASVLVARPSFRTINTIDSNLALKDVLF